MNKKCNVKQASRINYLSSYCFSKTFLSGVILTTSNVAFAHELNINVINPYNDQVSNVVVYATPLMEIKELASNTEQLSIDQIDTSFSPYVTVLQKGQTIKFSNKDDITHHIYSVSGENRFEFKVKSGDERTTQELMSSEEVSMGCNIHDWMSGFALVVDTPFFGKTNKSGEVSFDLPEVGQYKITVWHPQLDTDENRISRTYNMTSGSQSFTIKLPKKLLPIPEQSGQDEFEFLEGY